MLRSLTVAALLAAAPEALAQAATAAEAPKPADDAAKDAAKPADAATPALPPLPGDVAPTTTTATTGTSDDMLRLKAELKNELKAEVQAELRAQLQNELEAAARDQATAKAAAQEWQEERWIEEVKPKLNFLELDGYFRFRADFFSRLDLGTYDPVNNVGTSSVRPPTLYRPFNGAGCTDASGQNFDGDNCTTTADDTTTIVSANMRLRLDPTLNVSEHIRIRTTVDVLDNVVLGSTPESLGGSTLPLSVFTSTQNTPQVGINSIYDSIRIRRAWGEVETPVGQLRFGRMPQHFGLGVLANSGNGLDQDAGDSADQVVFATRVGGFTIAPGYSFSSTGPFDRGGGAGSNGVGFFANEPGQRMNLDPHDDVHSIQVMITKQDSEDDIKEQLRLGNSVFNYGLFGVYRLQAYDIPSYFAGGNTTAVTPSDYVSRGASAGIGSLWARFQINKLKIEAEAVGIVGSATGTATTSSGISTVDNRLKTVVDDEVVDNALWILQGGLALESSYAFLNDQLVVGLDGGVASGDDAFGMGNRPAVKQSPEAGDLDGQQYGDCLERGDETVTGDDGVDVNCTSVDNTITNFRFDSDYIVDMILWREILGSVTDAIYVKPHIGYYFTPQLGVRADVIYSQTIFASSAPGQQNPLGVELNARAFYANDEGFYLMPQAGFLLPLAGLNHYKDTVLSDETSPNVTSQFRNAQFAWTAQIFAGIQF